MRRKFHGSFFVLFLFCANVIAQDKEIQGVVSDQQGPLTGASVIVKGRPAGVQTDVNGRFSIMAARGDNLEVSFAGYIPHELTISDLNEYTITLVADEKALESVVVIGYGTRKRQHLSGSVATVGSEVVKARPVTNTLSALQGQIPGVVIQRASGQPGSEGFNLNVRGFSSTNGGNSPMVLVDGIAGSLDLLNPDDIENVTVLKDAAASIYGARAAGGVVLVTTKKGRRGNPKIAISSNAAVSQLGGMMETPDNYQFAVMDNEANIHNGAAPMYTAEMLEKIRNNDPNPIPHPLYGGWMLFFNNTDWRKALFTRGFQHKHNVSLSGGGNSSAYYFSAGYIDQEGVIRYANDNNKRFNVRLNYDYNFSKRIRLETKIALENQRRSDVGGVGNYIITEGIFGMPNHPVYTQSGDKYFAQGGWGNAVAMAKEGETATFNTRNVNTNFRLTVDVLEGLKLNLQTGINYGTQDNTDIAKGHPLYTWDESSIAYYSIANPDQNNMTRYSGNSIYRNFTGYLQYNKTWDRHEFDIMGGISHEENDNEWFSAYRDNFATDEVWNISLGSTSNMKNDGGGDHWAIRSLFSRLGYIYNNRYILEANLRYDGSSRFHKDTRWGMFPGLSVAWRLSEENFIKSSGIFNDLKLRVSYGETGNQEGINLYDYYQLITIGKSYPFGAGLQAQAAYSDTMVSLNRTWETLVNKNIGVDMTLLSSRLNFTFDYFLKRNEDMLIPVTYPSVIGAIPPSSNSGELRTQGFETSLSWRDRVGDFEYSARLIFSDAKNKLVNYGGDDSYTLGWNEHRENYPLNSYFAYVFDGVIRDQKELDEYKLLGGVPGDIGIGDARFRDLNGDGNIDPINDIINVGNTSPRYSYGINLGARYKNFDMSVFVQGVGKRTLFREADYAMPWSDWWRQPPAFYFGRTWNEDRPDAKYPRLSHGSIRYWNYQASTLQQINAAYARLKNLQIGYSLPGNLMKRLSLSNARIYLSGENIFELHNVKGGWDPESSASGFNYPFQRMYAAGIDITF